jgi:alpha-galactosidase
MLEVGNAGMSHDEYVTHMSLWALLAAPLLAGNDLRSMDADTKEILTNPQIIAVDQDSKGVEGHRVWDEGPLEIWSKPLADGSQAVGLFNRDQSELEITLDFKMLGISGPAPLHDMWKHEDLGSLNGPYRTVLPKHGVVMLKLSAQ